MIAEIIDAVAHKPDYVDTLRIIARERNGLSVRDRDTLKSTADDLEALYQRFFKVQNDLVEANGQRIAVNDRLIDALRREQELLDRIRIDQFKIEALVRRVSELQQPKAQPFGYSSGWLKVGFPCR